MASSNSPDLWPQLNFRKEPSRSFYTLAASHDAREALDRVQCLENPVAALSGSIHLPPYLEMNRAMG